MDGFAGYINAFFYLLLLSCFVKVILSLSILRIGLGLTGSGIGVVVFALAAALTYLIMQPQIESLGGLKVIVSDSAVKNSDNIQIKLTPFLEKHADPAVVARIEVLQSKAKLASPAQTPDAGAANPPSAVNQQAIANSVAGDRFPILSAAFLLTELKEGLELGILILIPFLVIDLLIANTLVLLGVKSLNADAISLPCKLLLFFAIDGWNMIAEKIINGYNI